MSGWSSNCCGMLVTSVLFMHAWYTRLVDNSLTGGNVRRRKLWQFSLHMWNLYQYLHLVRTCFRKNPRRICMEELVAWVTCWIEFRYVYWIDNQKKICWHKWYWFVIVDCDISLWEKQDYNISNSKNHRHVKRWKENPSTAAERGDPMIMREGELSIDNLCIAASSL